MRASLFCLGLFFGLGFCGCLRAFSAALFFFLLFPVQSYLTGLEALPGAIGFQVLSLLNADFPLRGPVILNQRD